MTWKYDWKSGEALLGLDDPDEWMPRLSAARITSVQR